MLTRLLMFAGQITTHRVGSKKPAPIGYPNRRKIWGSSAYSIEASLAIGVHAVHRIGGGVFVAALALVGKRVHARRRPVAGL